MKKTFIALTAACLFSGGPLLAAEHEVGQKNKAFSHQTLTVAVGDSVNFTNQDPFYHNIYSLSDTQTFDLGSYPKGQYGTVVFEREGKVEIECAIHPQMHMTIHVHTNESGEAHEKNPKSQD